MGSILRIRYNARVPKAAGALTVIFVGLASCACRSKALPKDPALAPAPSAPRSPVSAPLAGERIDIAAGAVKAGSVPGDPGRHPEIEQRLDTIELGPFRIDRLPYPNDPAKPPMLGVTREQADRLCVERSTRLCTELEWERACRGPDNKPYPTGDAWDERCAKEPASCATGFDVLGMGTILEWTASDVIGQDEGARRAAVRGAEPTAPPTAHRCAARRAEKPDAPNPSLGFRCCKGARNAALVAEPRSGQTFSQASITVERLTDLFRKSPRLGAVAKDIRLFREPDAAETVVGRGPGDRKGFLFTVAPLLWNPVAGADFLVATGRSGETTSFVVVFRVVGKDEYQLASSFIMENEVGPVALAYNGYIRPRLHFSTCWGCPGETGKILYKEPDSVSITQP
jgi:hypothetical protein